MGIQTTTATGTAPDIKVESYQHVASIGGWSGASRTLWAIATLGTALGGAIGVVAPLFPVLVGASTLATAASAIPASFAAFAATGMATGFSGGLMLGRISGTSAAVAEEQEKRMKSWTAAQIAHNTPGAEIVNTPQTPPQKANLEDTYRSYFNPKVGFTMAAIGAVGGLILGAAFIATGGAAGAIMPALGTLTGVAGIGTNSAAILAYSTGVMAAFGSLWTLNLSKITAATTAFFGHIISGKPMNREWGPEKSPEPAVAPTLQPAPSQQEQEEGRAVSYRDIVAQQQAAPPAPTLNR